MKPQVSYSGNVSLSTVNKKVDVLNADEYRNFITSYYGADSDAAKLLGTGNTDWQDEIYRTAISTDHNVTVSGGIKNMPYRVSVGYTDQNGVLKTSNYQRTTASLNLNPSFLKDHLKFNINGKFMYAHSRYANTDAISAAVRMDPHSLCLAATRSTRTSAVTSHGQTVVPPSVTPTIPISRTPMP